MGIFDRFKKQPKYDATNIRVTDLDKNFVFDYDLKTWIVTAVYDYDWGDNYFTREYKVESDSDVAFLHVSIDDELELTLSTKERLINIGENLPDEIVNKQTPPSKIEYQGKIYFLEGENPGYFNDVANKKDWIEFISWDYADKSSEYVLTIEQWGEREFEASYGKILKEFEISNIYPNNN